MGITSVQDNDRAAIESDFIRLDGATFTHAGYGRGNLGQPNVLFRDANTGRFFNGVTNEDIYFLPSESSAYIDAVMSIPADKIEGTQLVDYVNKPHPLTSVEGDWVKLILSMLQEMYVRERPRRLL